jgi:hypothetical protein
MIILAWRSRWINVNLQLMFDGSVLAAVIPIEALGLFRVINARARSRCLPARARSGTLETIARPTWGSTPVDGPVG